ncbi:MAG TPA: hypothetical protein VGM28_02260 [Candidatus Limnocylindrales bacterium]
MDRSAAIYGSLLVTTLVAAESRYGSPVDFLALSVLVSAAVFWLMEVWSELVNLRVRGPITFRETAWVCRNESPMLGAAVVPFVILVLPRLGVITVDQAINLALAACMIQLFLWGLAVGHAIGRGWTLALVVATGDFILGLLIVALKVWVIH